MAHGQPLLPNKPRGVLCGATNYGGNKGCTVKPYPGGCGAIFKPTE
jgi:hypothetical protein